MKAELGTLNHPWQQAEKTLHLHLKHCRSYKSCLICTLVKKLCNNWIPFIIPRYNVPNFSFHNYRLWRHVVPSWWRSLGPCKNPHRGKRGCITSGKPGVSGHMPHHFTKKFLSWHSRWLSCCLPDAGPGIHRCHEQQWHSNTPNISGSEWSVQSITQTKNGGESLKNYRWVG